MVRIGFPGGPRLEWYDRNPIPGLISYSATGVAPHGATIRASYTVPTGKKAIMTLVSVNLLRATAATTVGLVQSYGGTATSGVYWFLHRDNTVGAFQQTNHYAGFVVFAGLTVSLVTEDASTAGTMNYNLSVTYVEFDA